MALSFLDSSALFRRYLRSEVGGSRLRQLGQEWSRHTLFITRLALVECASARSRRLREGTISVTERNRLWQLMNAHAREQYKVIELDDRAYAMAEHLLFAYRLRTLDALQLAGALVITARIPRSRLEFWTADRQQAHAAAAEGLAVELLA